MSRKAAYQRARRARIKAASAAKNSQTAKIAEANQLAVDLGLAKEADFTGLDPSVANDMIRAIRETREMFPELPPLDYVSGFSSVERFTGEKFEYPDGAVGVFTGENSITGRADGKAIGIAFNEAHCGNRRSITSLLSDLRIGIDQHQDHPEGCYTIKSLVDHEIGHWLTLETGAVRDKRIMSLFRKHKNASDVTVSPTGEISHVKRSIKSVLSKYASTNQYEFIAEAWSEYRNNPNPRPVALEIGQRLEKRYREVHKK